MGWQKSLAIATNLRNHHSHHNTVNSIHQHYCMSYNEFAIKSVFVDHLVVAQ